MNAYLDGIMDVGEGYIEMGWAETIQANKEEAEFQTWLADFQKRSIMARLRSVDRHNRMVAAERRIKRQRRFALPMAVLGAAWLGWLVHDPHPYHIGWDIAIIVAFAMTVPLMATIWIEL